MAVLVLVALAVVTWQVARSTHLLGGHSGALPTTPPRSPSHSPTHAPTTSPTTTRPTTPTGAVITTPGPINTAYPGLTTFRGNATRDYYGEGPLPTHPKILWEYPASGGLCSTSSDIFGTRTWCGTGWTGQPNVIQHPGGLIEVREGAYDAHYHFWNGLTGVPIRPDLVTGDLAKGSATSDADGYPLYYAGSRDNHFRVVALDRKTPTVLYSFDSNSQVGKLWNDDWDAAALQVGDYLMEGSENSWFYIWKLNRHYDSHHLVQVNVKMVMAVPGFDQLQLNTLGDHDVSIENSVAFDAARGVVYFSNSGGLVQGWDVSDILKGGTHYKRVFRFWDGDETDATIVIDPQGYLYVGRHITENIPSRSTARDHQIGALMKLDPTKPNHPVVWSTQIGGYSAENGILGTPALYNGTVYVTDASGGFVAVSQRTGKQFYEVKLPGPTWMSPVPIDQQLLVGDCSGVLHDYNISNPSKVPKEKWHIQLSGCEESTPAVWHGMIYVGTRGGKFYGIGDAKKP
jgi:outer membrane protein assembly factor BamB